ncbi:flagellar protein FlaG [Brevibacillus ginsengisoli]|uniref:flagellar protein FlaG n=1 Tax=Brevibacillus ginsengisoli TaxID=363854 RepID=UPI003CF3AA29
MDINSVGNVGRITTAYEKTLASDTTNKAQTSYQPAPVSKSTGSDVADAQETKVDKDRLKKELDGLNKWLQFSNTHLKFQLHDELKEYYVEVVDDQTNEVIREIPSKKMMDMVAQMHKMIGILVDEKR